MAEQQTWSNAYVNLRQTAIGATADRLGLTVAPNEPFGILMEAGYTPGAALLVAIGDGSAGIYFSGGGDVIGGEDHAAVRSAAKGFVTFAPQNSHTMERTTSYPYPEPGQVRFFVLTASGVLTGQALEDELRRKVNKLWPLYYCGQKLITELRLISTTRPDLQP